MRSGRLFTRREAIGEARRFDFAAE